LIVELSHIDFSILSYARARLAHFVFNEPAISYMLGPIRKGSALCRTRFINRASTVIEESTMTARAMQIPLRRRYARESSRGEFSKIGELARVLPEQGSKVESILPGQENEIAILFPLKSATLAAARFFTFELH
jgi:hypothetical protein